VSIVPSYEGSASVSFILKLIRAALRSSLLAKLPLSILFTTYTYYKNTIKIQYNIHDTQDPDFVFFVSFIYIYIPVYIYIQYKYIYSI